MSDKKIQTVVERTGYKISPYRLAQISKTVAKVMQIVTNPTPTLLTTEEVNLTLDVVKYLIERGGVK